MHKRGTWILYRTKETNGGETSRKSHVWTKRGQEREGSDLKSIVWSQHTARSAVAIVQLQWAVQRDSYQQGGVLL